MADCDCHDRIDHIIDTTMSILIGLVVLGLVSLFAYGFGYRVGYDNAFKVYLKG